MLENADCDVLADSVALVIALSAPPSAQSRRELMHDEQNRLVFMLGAHAAAVAGPLPQLAPGAGGTLAIEGLYSLRVELGGSYYAAQSARFESTNIGGRFTLLRLGLRVCRAWTLGALDLAPCLGAQLYRIEGNGFGGVAWSGGAALMWGPALGVFSRLRLFPRLALYLAADGVVPVSRQRFVFSDVGPLHRPSALAFQLFVGPEVQF